MKKIIFLSTIFIALSANSFSQEYKKMMRAGTFTVQEIQERAELFFEGKDKGRGSGYKQFKRWEYNALRMQDESGYLKPQSYYSEELEKFNASTNNQTKGISANDNWEELGPVSYNATSGWNPGVGRITSIAVDKTDNNHIIVGAESGGIWRTVNGGISWTPLTDNFANLYVFSLAIDPMNSSVYYWGSTNGRMYKSIDSGATWTALANVGLDVIVKINIHPTNSNIMFAASDYSGIYRSTDGGASWSGIGAGNSYGYDMEFKPGDPNTVYATGYGFFKSIDGGATFSSVSGFGYGAKMIAVSPADPTVVYVLETDGGIFGGLYKSVNSGSSFTELAHTKNYFGYSTLGDDLSGQAPRDMDIVISPIDINEVHIAGINTWKSSDGGVSFIPTSDWTPYNAASQNIGYCHADVDIMEFVGNTIYLGTDGGIFLCNNSASVNTNYYTDISAGLGIRHFYKIGLSQTDPVIITGGSQDNGTSFYDTLGQWKDWLGADGMESFVDKSNSNTMYGTIQFGYSLYKTVNGGNSYIYFDPPVSYYGSWVIPYEQDPVVSNTIYAGYQRVYKSIDGGLSWDYISQNFGENLNHLKIAPSNNQVMYASNNYNLYKTTTASGNWTALYGFSGYINSIAIHPTDPNKVAVATAGYQKVYVSIDGGANWVSYKKNLPDFSALSLVWQENANNGLYVGMNYGVYYIDDSFTEWQVFNNLLPNVIINELEINTADNKLYAATYGRGAWRSPVYNSMVSVENTKLISSISVYPNPANDIVNISWDKDYKSEIRLFDLQGRIVYFSTNVELLNNHSVDISNLDKGIYFLKISTEKGVLLEKLIKK